jgi:DNA polymerase III delta subunit
VSSYGQWLRSFSGRGPSRVTWVCGPERTLVSEVVSATCRALDPDETEAWTAGRDREKLVWASVLAIPFTERGRVVVVRDAHKLRDWEKLRSWLDEKNALRGSSLVFESGQPDFPRDSDGKLAEPCTWLRDSSSSQVVRCTSLDPDEAVAWACRQMDGLTASQATHLLERASGNLPEVRNVLSKARMFDGQVSDQALDLLCSELPGDFADKLISGDRKGAMLAAESLGSDLGWSLGLLASRLDTLAALHRAARDNVSRRDVVSRLGVPAFLAQKYAGVARDYGENRVSRCWGVLATVEDAYRSGACEGAAEVLVASW